MLLKCFARLCLCAHLIPSIFQRSPRYSYAQCSTQKVACKNIQTYRHKHLDAKLGAKFCTKFYSYIILLRMLALTLLTVMHMEFSTTSWNITHTPCRTLRLAMTCML